MVGMGAACKGEVNLQGARHATNYRLDVRVRKECETDVQSFCADVDAGQEGHALVLHCMVDKFKNLSGTCQSEVRSWGHTLSPDGSQLDGRQSLSVRGWTGVVRGAHGPVAVHQDVRPHPGL